MAAIGYVTIGAIDSKKSGAFYDAVFTAIGSERKLENGRWIGYGTVGGGKTFMDCHTAVCPPFDGKEARAGNGIMVAYHASSADAVKAAYEGGMKNGGSDEGGPGFRPPEAKQGFYAAYMRDPTGNKLCVFALVRRFAGLRLRMIFPEDWYPLLRNMLYRDAWRR